MMMTQFTLRQLEYLVASVDHGTIAGAAADLNVSQPTISVAISKLEDLFGIQLLARHHSKGVRLAPNADEFLKSARDLLAQAQALQNLAISAKSGISGTLRLGSYSALAPTVLPRLISALAKDNPNIKLHLTEGSQDQLVSGLQDGRLEMAILYDIGLPDNVRVIRLSQLKPYAALGVSHPLTGVDAVSLKQLENYPFIILDVAPSRDYFLGLFKAANLTPNIAYSSPSLELVRGMVGRGLGYSLLVTRPKGDRTHDGKKLIIKPIKDKIQPSDLVLCHNKNLQISKIMERLEMVALAQFA